MITNNKDTQSQLNMKTCLKCEVYSIKKFIFAQFHRIFVIFSFTSFFLKIFLLCLFFILFNLLPADLLGLVVYWQIICRLRVNEHRIYSSPCPLNKGQMSTIQRVIIAYVLTFTISRCQSNIARFLSNDGKNLLIY